MNKKSFFQSAVLLACMSLPGVAGSLTTTFAYNDAGTGNMFNLTTAGNAIKINSLDALIGASPVTLDVYIKTVTYVGFDTTPAAWTLVSTTSVTGQGATTPTLVNVTPFTLNANTTYGMYVTLAGTGVDFYYTRGNDSFSNSDLSLSLGDGLVGLFGSTSVFTGVDGRTWDGTINYTLVSTTLPEPSSMTLMALAGGPGLWLMRRRYLRK